MSICCACVIYSNALYVSCSSDILTLLGTCTSMSHEVVKQRGRESVGAIPYHSLGLLGCHGQRTRNYSNAPTEDYCTSSSDCFRA